MAQAKFSLPNQPLGISKEHEKLLELASEARRKEAKRKLETDH